MQQNGRKMLFLPVFFIFLLLVFIGECFVVLFKFKFLVFVGEVVIETEAFKTRIEIGDEQDANQQE